MKRGEFAECEEDDFIGDAKDSAIRTDREDRVPALASAALSERASDDRRAKAPRAERIISRVIAFSFAVNGEGVGRFGPEDELCAPLLGGKTHAVESLQVPKGEFRVVFILDRDVGLKNGDRNAPRLICRCFARKRCNVRFE